MQLKRFDSSASPLNLFIIMSKLHCYQHGKKTHYGDHFSGTIHLDQSLDQKLWKTLTWHCCMCCNPANGRVEFEELLAYKNPATW